MSLPKINISFKEQARKTFKTGERGIVALILEEDEVIAPFEVFTDKDIPSSFSFENKEQIKLALIGYVDKPRKIVVCTVETPVLEIEADYTEAQNYLETIKVNYIAVPQIKASAVDAFATWTKGLRDDKKKKIKSTLPDSKADHEGVINFTTKNIVTANGEYTTAEYCSRIAGLLAGTPLTIASTYAPLPEILDIEKKSDDELDAAIDNGEFVLYNDGEKVKVGRGVNSLTTTTDTKGDSFKKIKIVEAMDLIYDDLRKQTEDEYLGKYSNSYDNKCILMTAMLEYLQELERIGILENGSSTLTIDIEKQIEYLVEKGIKIEDLSDKEIKEADTGSKVFFKAKIKILDAIEDIDLPITI